MNAESDAECPGVCRLAGDGLHLVEEVGADGGVGDVALSRSPEAEGEILPGFVERCPAVRGEIALDEVKVREQGVDGGADLGDEADPGIAQIPDGLGEVAAAESESET